MALMLLYAPCLLLVPLVLLALVFLVFVPGVFILLLTGAYSVSVMLVGLVGLAAERFLQMAARAKPRRAKASPTLAGQAN